MNKKIIFFIISLPFWLIVCNQKEESADNNMEICQQKINELKDQGYKIIDFHAHLKGGLTMDELLAHANKTGIDYGVAVNGGRDFLVNNDSALSAYYHSVKHYPVYHGLQAEGREWLKLFSQDTVALFDYVFTDALTFTDWEGRRVRLWMNDEVFIDDQEQFMDYYVNKIVEIITNEPVDIFVNPSFLPEVIRDDYDKLWTDKRMEKVINALVKKDMALEINARMKIPSAKFIKKAKAAGVKFTLGTNNGNKDLGCLAYSLNMIDECNLKSDDFWKIED